MNYTIRTLLASLLLFGMLAGCAEKSSSEAEDGTNTEENQGEDATTREREEKGPAPEVTGNPKLDQFLADYEAFVEDYEKVMERHNGNLVAASKDPEMRALEKRADDFQDSPQKLMENASPQEQRIFQERITALAQRLMDAALSGQEEGSREKGGGEGGGNRDSDGGRNNGGGQNDRELVNPLQNR